MGKNEEIDAFMRRAQQDPEGVRAEQEAAMREMDEDPMGLRNDPLARQAFLAQLAGVRDWVEQPAQATLPADTLGNVDLIMYSIELGELPGKPQE